MFCIQETESTLADSYMSADKDPLDSTDQQSDSEDEPDAKRSKLSYTSPGLNLQVYNIPAFNIPKSLSIFPSPATTLPKFVNNPLNLANPLAIAANGLNNLNNGHKRYSLPSKLSISMTSTPHKPAPVIPKPVFDSGGDIIRYKKNGEVAKKRGPPKGYKRKPKMDSAMYNNGLTQAQNALLNSLLVMPAMKPNLNSSMPNLMLAPMPTPMPAQLTIVPQIKVPEGTELVEMNLDPADWFPEEPYRMVFSRKKNPKWKNFPYRCEHCFKGYRVVSTLITHSAERHGCLPKELAIPCPCCPHVSIRRKHHKKHLESHESRRHRIFCLYCLPPVDPKEPYMKESERFPFDKFPQYWYASEESLRLHKKRKHPYAAMYNYNWFGAWGEHQPNS